MNKTVFVPHLGLPIMVQKQTTDHHRRRETKHHVDTMSTHESDGIHHILEFKAREVTVESDSWKVEKLRHRHREDIGF